MKLYLKLAWEGIRKNKRLYLPYFLTCTGMVMMVYIVLYLSSMSALKNMAGGRSTAQMLGFGIWIMALFALIFLLYTNSFLIRRRQKEFGLYNILGMGKRDLCLVYLWETVLLFAGAMTAGLLGGVLLSKLAELGLLRMLNETALYSFTVSGVSLVTTAVIFAVIFGLILLRGLVKMYRLSAVHLLQSENVGEKPPKANYLLGVAGILLLAVAYYIAVSIQNPLAALAWFFIAVCMVIVATYLLFISGSVMLCRLLQKNKGYYYQKRHFVAVSSMAYRMKRNGAGLASICILSTMVLVMILGAGTLYFGAEDSLTARYPREMNLELRFALGDGTNGTQTQTQAEEFMDYLKSVVADHGVTPSNEEQYCCANVTGLLKSDGTLTLSNEAVNGADMVTLDDLCSISFVPLADYNRAMHAHETLADDEVLLHCVRRTYDCNTITMADGTVWRVQKQVSDIMGNGDAAMNVIPTVFVVVPDLQRAIHCAEYELALDGGHWAANLLWSFDTDVDAAAQIALNDALYMAVRSGEQAETFRNYSLTQECREAERGDFYSTFGGIFFLGILLSVVFLAATALIIYYKQITEGYEDESRFAIMRKVGMTAKDIRQSVNSQLLTVFFLPLLTAVIHTAFAFPMVQRLLALFNFRNQPLMLAVAGGVVLLFGLFYTLIYKATSNAYYHIVSGARED